MTTTIDRETEPASPDAGPRASGRLMRTPAIEPLSVAPEDRARNLVDLILRAVERDGQREAMRWKLPRKRGTGDAADAGWTSRTYREMWSWITDVSLGLRDLGVADGDRVCILGRTRPEWVIADVASLALGAVTCPIYPQSEPGQAAFVINNVGATTVFVENAQQAAKIESIRAECPTVRRVIALDDEGKLPTGTLTLGDVVARADTDPAVRRLWRESIQSIGREHLSTIIHTSGTTANPKGAVLTHGGLLYNFEAATQVIDIYPTDVFLSFLPLSHIYGRIADEFVALGIGATIAYAEPLIERLPANMVEVKPTVMASVPRLYERVYGRVQSAIESGSPTKQRIFHWAAGLGGQKYENHLAGRPDSLWLKLQLRVADALVFKKIRERTGGRVRYFVSAAAPLSREIGEFFYGMGMLVLEGYGLTETSPFVSVNRPDDFVFGTVGRPAPGSEVMIDATTGEILVRGPQVMQGYLNQPDETAQAIDADGWFHTEDIGELDEIGRIRITDRQEHHHPRERQERLAGADGGRAVDLQVRGTGGDPGRPPAVHGGAHRARLRGARDVGGRERPGGDASGRARGGEVGEPALRCGGEADAGRLRRLRAPAAHRDPAAIAHRGGGGADPVAQDEEPGRPHELGRQGRLPVRREGRPVSRLTAVRAPGASRPAGSRTWFARSSSPPTRRSSSRSRCSSRSSRPPDVR